jgi:hypothetical protein
MSSFMLKADVIWSSSHLFAKDSGTASVALNNSDDVFVMYGNKNSKLLFNFGKYVNIGTSITWTMPGCMVYNNDNDTGVTPAVAMNDNGDVIEVHKHGKIHQPNDKLYYNTGKLTSDDQGTMSFKWGNDIAIYLKHIGKNAHYPSVAINNSDQIAVAYQKKYINDIQDYKVGIYTLFGQLCHDGTVKWGKCNFYKSGQHSSISLNNSGNIVITYSGDSDKNKKVYSGEGQIDSNGKVTWGGKHYDHIPYDNKKKDLRNSVVLNVDGVIIDELCSATDGSNISYIVGQFRTHDGGQMEEIHWGHHEINGSYGSSVALAMNDKGHFVDVHYNSHHKAFYSKTGFITNS